MQCEENLEKRRWIHFLDILPSNSCPLKALLVGKVPTPSSVATGHYFQGIQGKMLWNKLVEAGLMEIPPGVFEDDQLLKYGLGITDVVKKPREFREEPSKQEYEEGMPHILSLVNTHKPKVLIFIYKRVLDMIMQITSQDKGMKIPPKSKYGFNHGDHEKLFGCKVFVFPMPGTACKREESVMAMKELVNCFKIL